MTSFTFMYQPYAQISDELLNMFQQQKSITPVMTGRRLIVLEGDRKDLEEFATSLNDDWIYHETSTTPFPGPDTIMLPDHIIQAISRHQ